MTVSSPIRPTRSDTERLLSGIWSLSRMIGQDIDPLLQEQHGIDMRAYGLLKMIQGSAYPKDLAQKLKLPGSLVSRHLDQLQTLGLIERHIDEKDSRRIRLALTARGQEVTHAASEGLHHSVSARLAHLSPEARAQFLDTLEGLTRQTPAEATP